MSDPKAMTLEEAVEIVARGQFDYCTDNNTDMFSHIKSARWDRARAIVDQAVKAHKARCEFKKLTESDLYSTPVKEIMFLVETDDAEFDKLRALERGESEAAK